MHFIFSNPAVVALGEKITDRITKYHQNGGADFGAIGMVKWLKDNLTSEEIDTLALTEVEAGEFDSTEWLFDALQRRTQPKPIPLLHIVQA